MKFNRCVGEFIIVAKEVAPSKQSGKIHVFGDSSFAKGKVICGTSEKCEEVINPDDEILFIDKQGVPVGHEQPPNVVAVNVESVVVVLEPEVEEE